MNGSKFKGIPSVAAAARHDPREAEVQRFVAVAPGKLTYPWQDSKIRSDLTVQLNVRQPEDLMVRVDWFCTQTGVTKRDFVEQALRSAISAELDKMGVPKD